MIYVMILLMQLIPTPVWPDLTNPTPYVTTTPAPTMTSFITPTSPVTNTPSGISTVEIPENALLDNLSTSESELIELSSSVDASGDQIYWNGNPVLPNENGSGVFGYIKWLTSTSGETFFGPFAPIMFHLGILFSLIMLSLFIYFTPIIIRAAIRVVSWIVDNVLQFIPFLG
jgi:hypothetical protein